MLPIKRHIQALGLAATLLLVCVAVPPAARAAGLAVTSTLDQPDIAPGNGVCATATGACTLRAAIMEANALAGPDSVTLPADTFTLTLAGYNDEEAKTGDLDILGTLTLTGAGMGATTIDGPPDDSVFDIKPGAVVTMSALAVTGGNSNYQGGGIFISSGSALNLNAVDVHHNTTEVDGAGIFNNGSLRITASSVRDNTTGYGAGIYSEGTLEISNSTIKDNRATQVGGGLLNDGDATVNATRFENNRAGSGGGVMDAGGVLRIVGGQIVANRAEQGGAGAYNLNDGELTLDGTLVSGNVADSDATGDGDGGGVLNRGKLFTLVGVTVENNSATVGGGVSSPSGAATIMTNTTISGNQASIGGGFVNTGTATLNNVTVAYNSAPQNSGGLYSAGGTLWLANTLVAHNFGAANVAADCSGPLTSAGYNIVAVFGSLCGILGDAATTLVGAQPQLGGRQDNGGPTPTHALLQPICRPGCPNPAIDSGNPAVPGSGGAACEATDQRGVARPQTGRCDIGAFEREALAASPSPVPGPSAPPSPPPGPQPMPAPNATFRMFVPFARGT